MTIRNCSDEFQFTKKPRLGVSRVELQIMEIGSGIAADGRMHFPLLGRVSANGPESAWAIGQLLACCTDRPMPQAAFIDIDAGRVLAVPDGVKPELALQMPLLWPLLYAALGTALQLRPREAVLIHRGDEPLGQAAIRLAVALDCTVMAVCGDRDGVQRALAAGAVETARYTDDWPTLMREHGGVDAVFDPDGGEFLARSLACARRGARLGALDSEGHRPEIDMDWPVLWKRQASLMALDWSPLREWQLAEIARNYFMRIHDRADFS